MPTLALISRDSDLYQELITTLQGTSWSVERLGPQVVGDSELPHEVVALDATHPEAGAWGSLGGKPVLLLAEKYGTAELTCWRRRHRLSASRAARAHRPA